MSHSAIGLFDVSRTWYILQIQGTMDVKVYLEILQRYLFDTIQAYDLDSKQQQDNSSYHVTTKVY